jgi:hypothetical protein
MTAAGPGQAMSAEPHAGARAMRLEWLARERRRALV